MVELSAIFKSKHGEKHEKVKIPWYIIGFFIVSLVNSFGLITESISAIADFISSQFEIILPRSLIKILL